MTFITREKIKETYDDYETSKYDLYSEVCRCSRKNRREGVKHITYTAHNHAQIQC